MVDDDNDDDDDQNWMPTTNGGAGVGELDGRRRRALAGQAVNFHL